LLLPDLDGLSVCEILKRQPSTGGIPILMLTAVGGQLSRFAGLECGADDYLVKPVRPRDLVRRVEDLLNDLEAAKRTVLEI
jgi:DNA-binding response OmpR family regulator